MGDLYDTDILRWSEEQASRLRRTAANERLNADSPDWDNVIEEIESVGREQLHAVEALLFQSLLHDLKAQGWPLSRDVDNWRADARGFRAQAQRRFTPSMRQGIDLASLYADARKALPDRMDGQGPEPIPALCPFTLDDLLAPPR